jgi:hypothetical protein
MIKYVMDVKEAGALGGKRTLELRGKEYMKELALKSAAARKKKRESSLLTNEPSYD